MAPTNAKGNLMSQTEIEALKAYVLTQDNLLAGRNEQISKLQLELDNLREQLEQQEVSLELSTAETAAKFRDAASHIYADGDDVTIPESAKVTMSTNGAYVEARVRVLAEQAGVELPEEK